MFIKYNIADIYLKKKEVVFNPFHQNKQTKKNHQHM